MDTYRILPEAWPADKQRTIKRSLIILGIFLSIAFLFEFFIIWKNTDGSRIGLIIVMIVVDFLLVFAVGGGLLMGISLRKSIFLDGKIILEKNHLVWKEVATRLRIPYSKIQSIEIGNQSQVIEITQHSGKIKSLPGPIENSQDLIQKLQARLLSRQP